MFAPRYWPNRYFAPRYWAPAGAVAAVVLRASFVLEELKASVTAIMADEFGLAEDVLHTPVGGAGVVIRAIVERESTVGDALQGPRLWVDRATGLTMGKGDVVRFDSLDHQVAAFWPDGYALTRVLLERP